MKYNNQHLSLIIIVALSAMSQINCSVAFGFVSTSFTSGDKCVACVSKSQFYCTNPSSKNLDCYNDQNDCPATNTSNG